jgi:hypothetical protein
MKRMTEKDLDLLETVPEVRKEYEIQELKKLLASTDYKAIKFAEGSLTESEFAPIRKLRQEWRDKINELETYN